MARVNDASAYAYAFDLLAIDGLGQPVTETVTEKFTITVETVHF